MAIQYNSISFMSQSSIQQRTEILNRLDNNIDQTYTDDIFTIASTPMLDCDAFQRNYPKQEDQDTIKEWVSKDLKKALKPSLKDINYFLMGGSINHLDRAIKELSELSDKIRSYRDQYSR